MRSMNSTSLLFAARRLRLLTILLLAMGALLAASPALRAQTEIPGGTALAVRLNTSLSSKKSKVGENITARVMQDIPLSDVTSIHAGAKVTGRVIGVTPAAKGQAATILLQFDAVEASREKTAVKTRLRAIASMRAVEQAELPAFGSDAGESSDAATTKQVGGEVVRRGGGHVMSGGEIVGEPVNGGVLGELRANPEAGCASKGNGRLQALWVFSTDACGAYDFQGMKIAPSGEGDGAGTITLTQKKGNIEIRGGSALLLQTEGE